METLTFQTSPIVTIATNTFINVPIILKFEDTNLIEIIKEQEIGYTTQIPIYHSDGTYLAKVKGTRMYLTKDGEKAGIKKDKLQGVTTFKMGTQTLFEIYHEPGDAFKVCAELYTPEGYFVKTSDSPSPLTIDPAGKELNLGGLIMSGNTFRNVETGIWIRKNGLVELGTTSNT